MAGDFLINVNGFSLFKAKFMLSSEKLLCWIFRVQETTLRHNKAKKIIVFSDYLKSRYLKTTQENKLRVIPIGVDFPSIESKQVNDIIHIGFIAKDFESKGGEYLLEAYKEAYKSNQKMKLTIIGTSPKISEKECQEYNIEWINLVPRDQLFTEYFPSFDVFAYPTLADGLPLVVLEALSFSIPILTSDILALPEMIGYGEAGEVTQSKDVKSIRTALNKMTNSDYIIRKKDAVNQFFRRKYWSSVTNDQLKKVYEECL